MADTDTPADLQDGAAPVAKVPENEMVGVMGFPARDIVRAPPMPPTPGGAGGPGSGGVGGRGVWPDFFGNFVENLPS